MKLIEYLPNFMQDIKEFKELFSTEDIEIEQLKIAIEKIFSEIIVKTVESYGLKKYEKMYKIINIAETIEARRVNILFKINNRIPFTSKWLISTLNEAIGKDNYKIDILNDKYIVNIGINYKYKDSAKELNKDLKQTLPANLEVVVYLFQENECKTYIGGIVHLYKNLELRQVN